MKNRVWLNRKVKDGNCIIFIVDKPLTFGHSQLIYTVPKKMDENALFYDISHLITKALYTMNVVFKNNEIHKNNDFFKLAYNTHCFGKYIKTLILKASASEKENEYKIHLVPYFQSNEELCKKNFQQNFKIDSIGGLLNFMGNREKYVDSKDFFFLEKELIDLAQYFKSVVNKF